MDEEQAIACDADNVQSGTRRKRSKPNATSTKTTVRFTAEELAEVWRFIITEWKNNPNLPATDITKTSFWSRMKEKYDKSLLWRGPHTYSTKMTAFYNHNQDAGMSLLTLPEKTTIYLKIHGNEERNIEFLKTLLEQHNGNFSAEELTEAEQMIQAYQATQIHNDAKEKEDEQPNAAFESVMFDLLRQRIPTIVDEWLRLTNEVIAEVQNMNEEGVINCSPKDAAGSNNIEIVDISLKAAGSLINRISQLDEVESKPNEEHRGDQSD